MWEAFQNSFVVNLLMFPVFPWWGHAVLPEINFSSRLYEIVNLNMLINNLKFTCTPLSPVLSVPRHCSLCPCPLFSLSPVPLSTVKRAWWHRLYCGNKTTSSCPLDTAQPTSLRTCLSSVLIQLHFQHGTTWLSSYFLLSCQRHHNNTVPRRLVSPPSPQPVLLTNCSHQKVSTVWESQCIDETMLNMECSCT